MSMKKPTRQTGIGSSATAGPAEGRPAGAHGFTLLEVMITVMIFGIGMIAILSVFPVAGSIQRNTMEDLTTRQVMRNVQATVTGPVGRPFDSAHLDPPSNYLRVAPLSPPTGNLSDVWPLASRSYPSFPNDEQRFSYSRIEGNDNPDTGHVIQRSMVWVPLFRNANTQNPSSPDWQTFIFLMRMRSDREYAHARSTHLGERGNGRWVNDEDPDEVPGVLPLDVSSASGQRIELDDGNSYEDDNEPPLLIKPGDWVLDSNGIIYRVIAADVDGIAVDGPVMNAPAPVNRIWFSPPAAPGQSSPCQRILLIGGAVE